MEFLLKHPQEAQAMLESTKLKPADQQTTPNIEIPLARRKKKYFSKEDIQSYVDSLFDTETLALLKSKQLTKTEKTESSSHGYKDVKKVAYFDKYDSHESSGIISHLHSYDNPSTSYKSRCSPSPSYESYESHRSNNKPPPSYESYETHRTYKKPPPPYESRRSHHNSYDNTYTYIYI